jgi:hypothetical protein
VGREGEGLRSNRPELVALWECLETHPDNESLLYLTDNESTLRTINKWMGGGGNLILAKTVDTDILRVIVIKLQERVQTKVATLLIKGKTYRGHPLNEETDIRSEMGRRKGGQEKTCHTPTNRTIYQWSETSKTKTGINTTKQTVWTQTCPQQNATRNTYREKEKEVSLRNDRKFWKTVTFGQTRQPFARQTFVPSMVTFHPDKYKKRKKRVPEGGR